jgi:hypothetical protein
VEPRDLLTLLRARAEEEGEVGTNSSSTSGGGGSGSGSARGALARRLGVDPALLAEVARHYRPPARG